MKQCKIDFDVPHIEGGWKNDKFRCISVIIRFSQYNFENLMLPLRIDDHYAYIKINNNWLSTRKTYRDVITLIKHYFQNGNRWFGLHDYCETIFEDKLEYKKYMIGQELIK